MLFSKKPFRLAFLVFGLVSFFQVSASFAVSDIAVYNATALPTNVLAAANVTLTYSIKNGGDVATVNQTPISFYISTDTVLSTSDRLMSQRTIGPLNVNQIRTLNQNVAIPNTTASGNYYILIVADSANINKETSLKNNRVYIGITVSAILPDYIIAYASLNGTNTGVTVCSGGVVDARASERVVSPVQGPPSTVAFYLSTAQTLNASSKLMATYDLPAIPSYTNITTGQVLITVPGSTVAGNYYIVFKANAGSPPNAELDTVNNLYAVPLAVTNPTVTAGSITGGPFCGGQSFSFPYTVSCGSLGTDNAFIAELSNSDGSFQTPTVVGINPGTGSGSVQVTMPISFPSGKAYRLRVRTTSPSTYSTNSAAFEIIAAPPAPTAANVPRCGPGTVTLTASGADKTQIYEWYTTATGGNALDTSKTFKTPVLTTTTTYYVALRNYSTLCEGPRTAVQAIINTIPTVTVDPASPAVCAGSSTTLKASGANTYIWSPALGLNTTTGATVSASPSQTQAYTVLGATTAGCFDTAYVTVTVNPKPATPSISVSGQTTFCQGDSVTLSAPSATSYQWSTGATTQSIKVKTSGTYKVRIGNSANCYSDSSAGVAITVNATPNQPTITASGPITFCQGDSVKLSAKGLNSFIWSTGATTDNIWVKTAGAYTVKTIAGNGCISISSLPTVVTVNPIPTPPTITVDGSLRFCKGGSVSLTASSPFAGTYMWNIGSTMTRLVINFPGSYSVKVTSAAGCTSAFSAPVQVLVDNLPATPAISPSGQQAICQGDSITLTSTTGTSYIWSSGAASQSIKVKSAGNYTVQVTNAQACTSATSAAVVVSVNPRPAPATITPSGPTTFCQGDSVRLTAAGNGTFSWSTGATTATIVVKQGGTFSVKVKSTAGCISDAASITTTANPVPETPTIQASGTTTFCQGDSVTLTATAGSGYSWSTGGTTQSIKVKASGTYTVRVSNAKGCFSTASAGTVVTVNPLPTTPSIAATGSTTFCQGDSVQLTASPGASFVWSNGATTPSIWVKSAGSYSVRSMDNNACSSGQSSATVVTVNPIPAPPQVSASGPLRFCKGGSVSLVASSPDAGTYTWSNGLIMSTLLVSFSGTYSATVTSAAGCTSAFSTPITVTVDPLPATPTISPAGSQAFCEGDSITLTSSQGTTYSWNNGATTPSIKVKAAGSYTVSITNAQACTSAVSEAVVVTINPKPAPPSVAASGPLTFCQGDSVRLTASGNGTFTWSTGATTASIVAKQAGAYSVKLKSAAGCTSDASTRTVIVNPLPVAPAIAKSGATTFCQGDSVTLTSSAPTGNLWSNGATTRSIVAKTAGIYSVRQQSSEGCLSTASASVTVVVNAVPAPLTITANGKTTFCAGDSVTLTASPASGYVWNTGELTRSIVVKATSQNSVRALSSAGCLSSPSALFTVTVNDVPSRPEVTAIGDTVFCQGDSVQLTASQELGYLWSNGATTQSIWVASSGSYSVKVTSINACTSPSSAVVHVVVNARPDAPAITASGPTTFCSGDSVVLTSPASSGIRWSTGATTQSITVKQTGVITLNITGVGGCVSAESNPVFVTVLSSGTKPTITPDGAQSICAGDSLLLTSSSASGNLWSNGATTQTLVVKQAGNFTVQVSANGCNSAPSDAVSVAVNQKPAQPTIANAGSLTPCAGDSVTLTAPVSSSYLWSNGATSPTIVVKTTGDFTVQVGNAAGCLSLISALVHVEVQARPSAPTVSSSGPLSFCPSDSVTLTADSSPVVWSTGETTQSIVVKTNGSYTAQKTSGAGCKSAVSTPVIVSVFPAPSAPSISASGPLGFCQGDSVVLSASPSDAYLWSDGSTTQSIIVIANGTYSVLAKSSLGCSSKASAPVVIQVSARPEPPVVSSISQKFCSGDSVALTSSGGAATLWNTGFLGSPLYVKASGVYTAQVNANGCLSAKSAPDTITGAAPVPAPLVQASGPLAFCSPDSVALSISSGQSVLWSTGDTTHRIVIRVSGNYSAKQVGEAGCFSPSSVALSVTAETAPSTPTVTASSALTFCTGDSVTLTASAAPKYAWNRGDTTQSITVKSAGIYSVITSTSLGCASASSSPDTVRTSTKPQPPIITSSKGASFCSGDSLVLSTATTGTVTWSTGFVGAQLTVKASGTFTASVDSLGCSSNSSAVFTANENPLPVATFALTMNQDSLAAASQDVGNRYVWLFNGTPTGDTTSKIVAPLDGHYTLVVQNATGCIDSTGQNVIRLSTKSIWLGGGHLYPNPAQGAFQLVLPKTGTFRLALIDMLGVERYATTISAQANLPTEVQLPSLPTGAYMVRAQGGGGNTWLLRIQLK